MPIDPVTGSLILGGAGQIMGSGENRARSRALNAAGDITDMKAQTLRKLLGLADAYDPKRDAQIAVDEANKTAGATLQASIKSLNNEFKNSGGSPGGDTAFDTSVDRVAKGVFDPLRMFTADKLSNAARDKIAAYSGVLQSGSGLAEEYLNEAQNRGTGAGAQGLFGAAIDKILAGMGKKKLAGQQGQLGGFLQGMGLGLR